MPPTSARTAEGDLLATHRIRVSITRSYSRVQTEMWRDKIEEIVRKYHSREAQAQLTKYFGEVRALAQHMLSEVGARTEPSIEATVPRLPYQGSRRTTSR